MTRAAAREMAESRAGGAEVVSLCAFEVNRSHFAIDLRRVREILRPLKITPLPSAPVHLEGLIHLRGAVVPVVDLRKRLGNPTPTGGPLDRLVVACIGRREVGFLVDRVSGVIRLPRCDLLPAPDLWLEEGARLFLGACRHEDAGLTLLLNLRALLSSARSVNPAAVQGARSAGALGGVGGK